METRGTPEVEVVYNRPSKGRSNSNANETTVELDVEALARWMDSVFRIPGLNLRFGLDAIFGLLPGIGDVLTSFVSFYILHQASQFGVSRFTLARMGFNLAIDYVLGSIPLIGDAFDVVWRANDRNAALLKKHLAASPREARRLTRGDGLFVGGIIAVLIAILVGSVYVAFLLVKQLVGLLI